MSQSSLASAGPPVHGNKPVSKMNIAELRDFLCAVPGSTQAVVGQKLFENDIDGESLGLLKEADIDSFKLTLGPRRALEKLISENQVTFVSPPPVSLPPLPPGHQAPAQLVAAPIPPNVPASPPGNVSPGLLNTFQLTGAQVAAVPSLAAALSQQQTVPLATAIMGTSADANNLRLSALVQQGGGSGATAVVKFKIDLDESSDPNASFNMANYGTFMGSFAAPDGTLLGNHIFDVEPADRLRPPVRYEFYNAMTGQPITSSVAVNFTDASGSTRTVSGNTTVRLPAEQVSQGVVNVAVAVPGFQSTAVRIIKYRDTANSQEVVRLLLTPTASTLREGVRAVLSWAHNPRDLDLHCYTSDGRHVFFSCRNQRDMNLDYDHTNGLGPETLTVSRLDPNVTYYFYVHHYSGSSTLYESQAALRIENMPGLQALNVPTIAVNYPQYNAMVWRCFKVCNGVATVKNDIAYVPNMNNLICTW